MRTQSPCGFPVSLPIQQEEKAAGTKHRDIFAANGWEATQVGVSESRFDIETPGQR